MQIDPNKRTHAQNRFLRRLNNRDNITGDSLIGAKGTPIPGRKTRVEISHNLRRRARRIKRHKHNIESIPGKILEIENKISVLKQNKDTDGIPDLQNTIAFLQGHFNRSEESLSRLH